MSTDQEPTTSASHSDHEVDQEATGLTISEAARRLGVSENAIRQRIKRETIEAQKRDGIWYVVVGNHEADHEQRPASDYQPDYQPTTSRDAGDQEPIEVPYRVDGREQAPLAVVSADNVIDQLRSLIEHHANQMRELAERNEALAAEVGMLRERTTNQQQRTGELEERLVELRTERDDARARVKELEAKTTPAAVFAEVAAAPTFQRIMPADAELRAEQERLGSRVAALEAENAAGATAAQHAPQRAEKRAWWRFWESS